jgi:N-glycosylase/DNA lyase
MRHDCGRTIRSSSAFDRYLPHSGKARRRKEAKARRRKEAADAVLHRLIIAPLYGCGS